MTSRDKGSLYYDPTSDKIFTPLLNHNPTCSVSHITAGILAVAPGYPFPCSSLLSAYFCSYCRQEYPRISNLTGHNFALNCDPGSLLNDELLPRLNCDPRS